MTGATQDGMPPYTFMCFDCGQQWQPPPNRQGQHTDHSLDKSFREHRCQPPDPPAAQEPP